MGYKNSNAISKRILAPFLSRHRTYLTHGTKKKIDFCVFDDDGMTMTGFVMMTPPIVGSFGGVLAS